jgi:hypothetical protein
LLQLKCFLDIGYIRNHRSKYDHIAILLYGFGYGCLSRKHWNVAIWSRHYMRNARINDQMGNFPFYNFQISFIKSKSMAKLEVQLLRFTFWVLWMFTYIVHPQLQLFNLKICQIHEQNPSLQIHFWQPAHTRRLNRDLAKM